MRKLVYYVGISIDGYIAGPNGEIDFYPLGDDMMAWIGERYPETLPTHVRAQAGLEGTLNQRFDTLVMGLGTYRTALDIGVTSPYAHMRQYVVSTTLGEISDPAVELVHGDPIGLVRRLKAEDTGKDIWLAGGGRLAGSLLPEIDELIVKTYAVLAGAGISMINGAFAPTHFTPDEHLSFSNGATVTRFVGNR